MSSHEVPSYRKVNYALRPAKQIERQMMLRAFQRLSEFGALTDYQYIGFGSLFFVDFVLVHRVLGLSHLVSIEQANSVEEQMRFQYNAPFRCVDVEFGASTDVLPRLEWQRRAIVWLDYDKAIRREMFSDIATVARKAPSGSVLAVTLRADRVEPLKRGKRSFTAVESFFRHIPEALQSAAIGESDVNSAKISLTLRNLVRNRIELTLAKRNILLPENEQLELEQIFFFEYADGAAMMTIGFVLVAKGERRKFDAANWATLPFLRLGNSDPFRIHAPVLTLKELRHLERQLPCPPGERLRGWGIPQEELDAFAETHPFYPRYGEIVG